MEDSNGEEDGKEDEEDAGMKVDGKVDGSGLENSPSRKVMPAWQGRNRSIIYNITTEASKLLSYQRFNFLKI